MRVLVTALAFVLLGGGPAFAERFQVDAASYGIEVTNWRDLPFRTVVRQQRDFSCGSAALATLLRHHYGRPATETEVFAAMIRSGDRERIERRGFSLLDMRAYLASQGLEGEGYRLSLDQLAQMQTPAIALIQTGGFRHFVVVKGVSDTRVLVGDPALGLRTYARADFERIWNGIAFMVEAGGGEGAFNRADEWRRWSPAPFELTTDRASVGQLTRELPPLYQITNVSQLGAMP